MEGTSCWVALEDCNPITLFDSNIPLPIFAWHLSTLAHNLEPPEAKNFSKAEGYGRYNTVWHEWEIPGQ